MVTKGFSEAHDIALSGGELNVTRVTGALMLVLWQAPAALAGQSSLALAVEPKPVLEIGEVLGDSPEYSFTDLTAIAVIGDSIFVLDGAANVIRVFNHHGEFLGRVGGEGEGPGEFKWPVAMRLVPEGIAVTDLKLRRQSFFSLKGELLRTEPLGQLTNQALAGSASLRSGVVIAETAVMMSSESGAFPERLLVLTYAETQRVDTIARYSTGYVPYRTREEYGFLGLRAGSEGDWAVAGDSLLAVVSGEPSSLQWWRAAEKGLAVAGQLRLPVRPESFTQDDARLLLERANEERRAEGARVLPRSVKIEPPRYWGQVRQLVVSSDHECWIQWDRPRSSEDDEWFRADLQRRLLERTRLPVGFRMLAAVGDKLYGFVLTEHDTPLLTVLRLRQTRSG